MREIRYIYLSKKDFINYMVCQVDLFVSKYRFYYPNVVVGLDDKKDLSEMLQRRADKNNHKIIMYYHWLRKKVYVVIYCKNTIKVFYTDLTYQTAKKYNKKLNDIYQFIVETRKGYNYGKTSNNGNECRGLE